MYDEPKTVDISCATDWLAAVRAVLVLSNPERCHDWVMHKVKYYVARKALDKLKQQWGYLESQQ